LHYTDDSTIHSFAYELSKYIYMIRTLYMEYMNISHQYLMNHINHCVIVQNIAYGIGVQR